MFGTKQRVYLDYNASAPIFPEVAEAVARALMLANPSSVHGEGRAARAAVEQARRQVAELVGADHECVVFTSGGSEAANALLRGIGDGRAAPVRLVLSEVEHPCVLSGHRFAPEAVSVVPVGADGVIDLAALEQVLVAAERAGERVLLALQLANNETGVLQPVRQASDLVHGHGGLVICDAVQAAGKLAVSLPLLGADALFLSAHKIGGPKGVGAIAFASTAVRLGEALVNGGGQEQGQRSGTENVAGIVGFGAAADIARARLPEMERVRALRDHLEAAVIEMAPEATIFGVMAARLPNTSAVALPGLRAETALIAFDLDGVALSSGSACSSGKVRPSGVLRAMGVPEPLAAGALRISLGWQTRPEDIETALRVFSHRVRIARERMGNRAA
jgi:cysteine desulfurase